MDNLDGIEGICGDRKFVDFLYLHYKLKNSLSDLRDNLSEEKANVERQSRVYYLSTVNYCVMKIQQLPDGSVKRSYLDWLRWNMDVIVTELERYETTPHLATLETTSTCKDNIRAIAESHFQLSEVEKSISNQYVHAYQRLCLPVNHPRKVYIFTGKLIINYINLLKDRFYISKLDRDGITFIQLEAEAGFLVTKLSSLDGRLASDIKTTIENYATFRLMDDALRRAEDENIEQALKLAHKRATESFVEGVRRHIMEAIRLIKLRLEEHLREAWKAAAVPFQPIRHPLEAGKNLVHFFSHPIESVKEIWNWAKERPWQSCAVVLSGIVIGAAVGGFIFFLPAFFFNVAATAITIPTLSLGLIGGIGGAIGGVTIPLALTSSKAVQLKAKAKQEIAAEKAKEVKLMAANDEEGSRIAKEALFEEYRRELVREAQKIADENIRRMREEEKRASEERERQINSLNLEELEATQLQLVKSNKQLAANLRVIQAEMAQSQKNFRKKQVDIWKVREGMAAVSRIIQNIGDKTGSSSECLSDSDSRPGLSNQQSDHQSTNSKAANESNESSETDESDSDLRSENSNESLHLSSKPINDPNPLVGSSQTLE